VYEVAETLCDNPAQAMIDEAKSKRAQNLGILVIVVGLVPFVLFLMRGAFLRFAKPRVPTVAPIATPMIVGGLKKVGGKLEVSIIIQNPSTETLTKVEVNKLSVEGTVVVAAKESLGPVDGGTTLTKRYTIPVPAKIKNPAAMSYDVRYEQGPYGGGSSSGFDSVNVK